MRKPTVFLVLAGVAAAVIGVAVAVAGGWTASTMHPLAGTPVAGKPFRVVFTVRQHGHRPVQVDGAGVEIVGSGGRSVVFPARALTRVGRYAADVVFPEPGTWRWRVVPGPFPMQQLSAITVRAAGAAVVAPRLEGRALFVRKGCVACHMGPDDPGFTQAGPPLDDLAGRLGTGGLAYVRQSILAPAAVVADGGGLSGGPLVMPRLEVTRAEADALATYLLARRGARP